MFIVNNYYYLVILNSWAVHTTDRLELTNEQLEDLVVTCRLVCVWRHSWVIVYDKRVNSPHLTRRQADTLSPIISILEAPKTVHRCNLLSRSEWKTDSRQSILRESYTYITSHSKPTLVNFSSFGSCSSRIAVRPQFGFRRKGAHKIVRKCLIPLEMKCRFVNLGRNVSFLLSKKT